VESSINQIEPVEFGPLLGVNYGTSLGAGSPNPTNTSFDYLLDECFPLFSISGLVTQATFHSLEEKFTPLQNRNCKNLGSESCRYLRIVPKNLYYLFNPFNP
jgi:hypothetical protein